jgi:hypothetical protein
MDEMGIAFAALWQRRIANPGKDLISVMLQSEAMNHMDPLEFLGNLMLLALNQTAANSMRFMLAAAGIDTEGPLGALRIQGGVLLFARVVEVWVDDEDKDMAKTMARLDRELDQAGKIIHRIEGFAGPKSPFHSLCERLKAGRPAPRPRRSRRDDEAA